MRLLLTGFEPFDGETINPSGEVVGVLEARSLPGVELTTLVLPVRGRISFELLLPELDRGVYDAWLGLGEAGGRPRLSVERVGVNVLTDRGPEAPADGEQTLVKNGPAAYFSQLPVASLVARMNDAGAPARLSNSAGTYICNEVAYVVQHQLAVEGRTMPSGFIHLPYLPEQTAGKRTDVPSMSLETQVLGVTVAIDCIRELFEA
jgi:pyroglutamyl-peptidase